MELSRANDGDPAREAAGEHDKDRIEHDIFSTRYLIRRPLLQALEPSEAARPCC